jgi:hypothetical protein
VDLHRPGRRFGVDDRGSYLDVTGGATAEGTVLADGFTWDWEKEAGDGWELVWRLSYARSDGPPG